MKKAGVLLAAAALTVTQLASSASATVPGCMTFSGSDPWKTNMSDLEIVRAAIAWSNYCAETHIVIVEIQTKVCSYGCLWQVMEGSRDWAYAKPGETSSLDDEAPCRDGTHRYRSHFGIYNAAGILVHEGFSGEPEFECDNTPAGPGLACPKYGDVACRAVTPP